MSDLRGPEYAANLTAEGAVKRALVEFDGSGSTSAPLFHPPIPLLRWFAPVQLFFPILASLQLSDGERNSQNIRVLGRFV